MADFQHRFAPNATIYISVPTWVNHHNIYRDAHVPQKTYRRAGETGRETGTPAIALGIGCVQLRASEEPPAKLPP